MTPEQQLVEVDELLRSMPSVGSFERAGPEEYAWLGRASALVHRWDSVKAIARFDGFASWLGSGSMLHVAQGLQGVLTMLHHVRQDAVLRNPQRQTVSVSAGAVFDYFDEVRKVVELAKSELFFVDPYLDADFVSRYLPFVARGVAIKLLAREKLTSLVASVQMFVQQAGATVHVRSASGFHDRYVFVDRIYCYQSGASFKDGARKSPTTLSQVTDACASVLSTYDGIWITGTVQI
jgi:hypothetical protein